MATNWKNTKIYEQLLTIKGDEAELVVTSLQADDCMSKVEKILKMGATSPKDFTLHDADHSFRVAERMWTLIPDDTKEILSEYELALLLLSAYLHDIGMTPEYKKVKNHYECLTNVSENYLTQNEKKEFQRWLDNEGEFINVQNDILENREKAEELVTFYCRYKHNDWSEDWIRTNFKGKTLGKYTNWINDLVLICRSHHEGLNELKAEGFDPIRIYNRVIHKRYIAMCLRMADVMEIDPERAPGVLIKHRNVIQGSLSHWLKEKFTSVDIVSNCISVTAFPTEAFIHKAIIEVADQIEHEANLCNTLTGEMPLGNISPTNNLAHEWKISPAVHREIKEAGNYEFIDGTFKPNSKKLLQLLAGTELYGNPFLAIRELVQNAFDAVKVQIGHKILEDELTLIEEFDHLKKRFVVELDIKKVENDYWLICKDNGVGMDKEIIKKCFLIGGASKRHELLELERSCKKIDYNLETTGHFGIGVLSYFMIADKMIIKTKKSIQSGNREPYGWEFEINGLSDFGELRKVEKIENLSHGTIILLKIKKEFIRKIESGEIQQLLIDNLVKIPCRFRFTYNGEILNEYSGQWCKDINYFRKKIVEDFDAETQAEANVPQDFLSDEEVLTLNISQKRKANIIKSFPDTIDFIVDEGKLENDNGYYRIHIPFFKNEKGDSFAFFFEKIIKNKIYFIKINNGFLFLPPKKLPFISWKGIKIESTLYAYNTFPFQSCFIELDLINEKTFQISVSRLEIIYKEHLSKIFEEIKIKIISLINLNKKRFSESPYSLFNHILVKSLPLKKNNLIWVLRSDYDNDFIKFEKIKLPIAFLSSDHLEKHRFLNKRIYTFVNLPVCGNRGYRDSKYEINNYDFKLDRVVFYEYAGDFKLAFLILDEFKDNKFSFIGNSASFPVEWNDLFCVYLGYMRGLGKNKIVLNENSPLIKYVNQEDFEYAEMFFEKRKDLKSIEAMEILKSKSKSLCFMLYLIQLNVEKYWIGLAKNNANFAKKIWANIFDDENKILYFYSNNYLTGLVAISTDNWKITKETKKINEIFPVPDENWTIKSK